MLMGGSQCASCRSVGNLPEFQTIDFQCVVQSVGSQRVF